MGIDEDLSELAACGPLRAWSVVVTVLGDLIRSEDDSISGAVLGHLVDQMGISNQTLRVALHRLRRDGWIRTERTGRTTEYFLSEQGWRTTREAHPLIYASAPVQEESVFLVAGAPAHSASDFADSLPDEAVVLQKRLALTTRPDAGFSDNMLASEIAPGTLPDWARDVVAPQDLRKEYSRFADRVSTIMSRPVCDEIFSRTTLRLLILHHWRRLRLRHGRLPDLLFEKDWEGAKARREVSRAMTALERPSIPDLSEALGAIVARNGS